MTVYPPVSVFLGDCGKCQLELDGVSLPRDRWRRAVGNVLDVNRPHVGS
jgi:hypothetical protein